MCSVSLFLRQPETKLILHILIMIAIMSLICALFPCRLHLAWNGVYILVFVTCTASQITTDMYIVADLGF